MRARLPVVALCAALSGWAASAGQARADVVYTFNTINAAYSAGSGVGTPGFSLSFDLTDAAVASGSFWLSSPIAQLPYDTSSVLAGDVNGLVRANLNGDQVVPTHTESSLQASLTFTASGDITSFSLVSNGLGSDIQLSGNEGSASGWFGSDRFSECELGLSPCSVSGFFTHTDFVPAIPEPASLALLGIGALALAAVRRRLR